MKGLLELQWPKITFGEFVNTKSTSSKLDLLNKLILHDWPAFNNKVNNFKETQVKQHESIRFPLFPVDGPTKFQSERQVAFQVQLMKLEVLERRILKGHPQGKSRPPANVIDKIKCDFLYGEGDKLLLLEIKHSGNFGVKEGSLIEALDVAETREQAKKVVAQVAGIKYLFCIKNIAALFFF